MTNAVSTIEVWQALVAAVGLLLSGVALIWLIVWRFYVWSDTKVSEQFKTQATDLRTLTSEHHRLAREFSGLRSEIRARFAIQDKQQMLELVNDALEKKLERMSVVQ